MLPPVKKPFTPVADNADANAAVSDYLKDRIDELVATAASERSDANKAVRAGTHREVRRAVHVRRDSATRSTTSSRRRCASASSTQGVRADGREITQIRPLDIHVGVLPRTHGTGLFTRGETQVLTIATLGGLSMAQKLDTLSPERVQALHAPLQLPALLGR